MLEILATMRTGKLPKVLNEKHRKRRRRQNEAWRPDKERLEDSGEQDEDVNSKAEDDGSIGEEEARE